MLRYAIEVHKKAKLSRDAAQGADETGEPSTGKAVLICSAAALPPMKHLNILESRVAGMVLS